MNERYCEMCLWELPRNNRRFCSKKCELRGRKKGVKMKCLMCGVFKYRTLSRMTKKFCSTKCGFAYKEKVRIREHQSFMRVLEGAHLYPKEFNDELKSMIKERDGYFCQNCQTTENLCIHHINYIKRDCDLTNLITLCMSCNIKANTKRQEKLQFYTMLLYEQNQRRSYNQS